MKLKKKQNNIYKVYKRYDIILLTGTSQEAPTSTSGSSSQQKGILPTIENIDKE